MFIIIAIILSVISGFYSLMLALGNLGYIFSRSKVEKKYIEDLKARENEWLSSPLCKLEKRGDDLYYEGCKVEFGYSPNVYRWGIIDSQTKKLYFNIFTIQSWITGSNLYMKWIPTTYPHPHINNCTINGYKCSQCGYLSEREGFYCPKCKKTSVRYK